MCERCLKAFPFPQGDTRKQWKYHVTGLFSVLNFSEGAYCVVLTLNMFSHKLSGPSHGVMTYTTGLNLKHEQFDREVDFAFWHSESVTLGQRTEPRFVFGEAKSFAEEAVTDRDIDTLKRVADAVPGSIVVVSVLKPGFGNNEKTRLAEFTKWGWKLIHGRPRAQVLLLTGIELFADFDVQMAWKNAVAPYTGDPRYEGFDDLNTFAHTTQKIHLGLDYCADLRARHAVA